MYEIQLKNQLPLVTVCITTYNRNIHVQKAIDSVLKQSYKQIELIVVDDGSKNPLNGLKIFKRKNIKLIRHAKNLGLASARNTGLNHANGKYIAYLDDDDEWDKIKIEKQILKFEKLDSTFAIVYCGMRVVNGEKITLNMPRLKGDLKNEIINKGLNTIPSSCIFRKDILSKIGGHDSVLKSGIDHDIWMTVAKNKYKVEYVDAPLVINYAYNIHQMTTNVNVRLDAINTYLLKWKPTLKEWYGKPNCEKYCKNYYNNAIGNLGFNLIKKGDVNEGRKILRNNFIRSPMHYFRNPALLYALLCGGVGYKILKKYLRL